MFKESKSRRVGAMNIVGQSVGRSSRMPLKYTDDDWDFNNRIKFRITDDQQKLAERIVAESKRVVDETKDTTQNWQREVEHHMKERTSEIKFLVDELNKQKKTALLEDEALSTYCNRIVHAINFLKEKSLEICQKCCIYREGRIGVDLVDDEVDRQLRQELKVTKGCLSLLDKTLKESAEQLRKLRAAMYLLDKDLGHKDKSLLIDQANLTLRQTQQNVRNQRELAIPKCVYSLSEWEHKTYTNIKDNAKELNSAKQLRAYVDILLKQVVEDMQNQTDRTNEAFEMRIEEMRHVKKMLEQKHSEIVNHISDVNRNLRQLESELSDREESLHLCMVRLSNRCQRPGLELTCDAVQKALNSEMRVLKDNICKLKKKIAENKASLRYLLHVQIMQEEEINIKANSLKIDEVDCMTIRRALRYQPF
ncbi:tektin-1 [Episyrphus balteatus]|uniref:tektin-1 n=1 Tax=Episyrphus balteatus TaxID=286459 RepID=UPI002486AF5E|nr:tektin-1 [Episyrphus balteatus]